MLSTVGASVRVHFQSREEVLFLVEKLHNVRFIEFAVAVAFTFLFVVGLQYSGAGFSPYDALIISIFFSLSSLVPNRNVRRTEYTVSRMVRLSIIINVISVIIAYHERHTLIWGRLVFVVLGLNLLQVGVYFLLKKIDEKLFAGEK